MAKYRLSRRATRKLIEIYAHTEIYFGRYQADAYNAGFERMFELIAQFPKMGREAEYLRRGLRQFRFQSHAIFYIEEATHVRIINILHQAQNLRASLFE